MIKNVKMRRVQIVSNSEGERRKKISEEMEEWLPERRGQ